MESALEINFSYYKLLFINRFETFIDLIIVKLK